MIPPMTLANMREHSVRPAKAECQEIDCGHKGSINVDYLPGDFHMPDVALRLRCSACGSKNVKTIPDRHEGRGARDYGP